MGQAQRAAFQPNDLDQVHERLEVLKVPKGYRKGIIASVERTLAAITNKKARHL